MAKKRTPVLDSNNKPLVPAGSKVTTVEVPDEAIDYIVSRFLMKQAGNGESLVTGVSTDVVETVLSLLVDWAAINGQVKDGILFIGGKDIT